MQIELTDNQELIVSLNETIFGNQEVISWEEDDIRMYVAKIGDKNVGFKIGFKIDERNFYSAQGGILKSFRKQGIATSLFNFMIEDVKKAGYQNFIFDTFPNKNPGMALIALKAGFQITFTNYMVHHTAPTDKFSHKNLRLRLEKNLLDSNNN
jgi:GNAT superfamily N-acetyltransferase